MNHRFKVRDFVNFIGNLNHKMCAFRLMNEFVSVLLGWDRNRSRNIPFYILPNVNTTIIQPTTLCKENTPILLLIVICSAADNFENRYIPKANEAVNQMTFHSYP